MSPIYIALVHYPVQNKHGEIVTTSLTNFDLHDLGRISTTYGVSKYFIVTPVLAQQKMALYIKDYWRTGLGASVNPDRREAFAELEVSSSINDCCLTIEKIHDTKPTLIVTSARDHKKSLRFQELRERCRSGMKPIIILFGTGFGLAPEVIDQAEGVLEPIRGLSEYNHLPVRGAIAIVLDRLLSR